MKITADALSALPGIRHGFFTRQGGVSDGIYASLNCGVGSADERAHVLENRARITADLRVAADRLATPYQVHSPDVVVVDEVWPVGDGPKADAVVTSRPGIAIGVGTADCGPVLFADGDARVVGAAHAGWKGAFTGVLEATVAEMEKLGARRERIVAVLGPTISKAAYEVGPEFRARFIDADAANAAFFAPSDRADHHQFDLPAYIGTRLRAAGLGTVGDLALCTYADPKRFFSYRRATHAGEPDYGRLLHAITIAA
ncbi:peptidoglycan editing factor PgeF [Kaistia nematophila]|uniref:Purine nucleoside phosphorylase n=1 Tax=Kaistia nematophila TaxID=2994654 RepID=A0A9X3INP8_9HYPH|nr:peptidoglycan editing factor PgeF [Kaistia nematophila]MCX5571806.1 peptidoglycan editing factor PgeF [Kaistia nematophila]